VRDVCLSVRVLLSKLDDFSGAPTHLHGSRSIMCFVCVFFVCLRAWSRALDDCALAAKTVAVDRRAPDDGVF